MKKLLLIASILCASFSSRAALHLLMGCPDGYPVAYYWDDHWHCIAKLEARSYSCPPTGPMGFKWIYLTATPEAAPGGNPSLDPGMPQWMNTCLDPALHTDVITEADQAIVSAALQSGSIGTSYVLRSSLTPALQAYFARLGL